MTLGRDPSQGDINIQAGNIALRMKAVFEDAKALQTYMLATLDAELTAKGFTQAEVNTLKSACTDMNKLHDIWNGTATQASTYDFKQFMDSLWGLGVRGGS